jgi:hypothetical protein
MSTKHQAGLGGQWAARSEDSSKSELGCLASLSPITPWIPNAHALNHAQ